jgi:hypothetical protein
VVPQSFPSPLGAGPLEEQGQSPAPFQFVPGRLTRGRVLHRDRAGSARRFEGPLALWPNGRGQMLGVPVP